jgi:hypothetical protein
MKPTHGMLVIASVLLVGLMLVWQKNGNDGQRVPSECIGSVFVLFGEPSEANDAWRRSATCTEKEVRELLAIELPKVDGSNANKSWMEVVEAVTGRAVIVIPPSMTNLYAPQNGVDPFNPETMIGNLGDRSVNWRDRWQGKYSDVMDGTPRTVGDLLSRHLSGLRFLGDGRHRLLAPHAVNSDLTDYYSQIGPELDDVIIITKTTIVVSILAREPQSLIDLHKQTQKRLADEWNQINGGRKGK